MWFIYIYIYVDNKYINFYQDFFGSYGLFLYKENNYWALSNSFFYLLQNIKHNNIKFNYSYACELLISGCSTALDQTLIHNIIRISPYNIISIDIKSKTIAIKKSDTSSINSINESSTSYIETIDTWITKWRNYIQSILTNNFISVDISGGFDSRIVLSLFYPFFNNNKLNFFSSNSIKFTKDFKIAKQIADYYGFSLNTFINSSYKTDLYKKLNVAYFLKFGFEGELNDLNYEYKNLNFKFSGAFGEAIRAKYYKDIDDILFCGVFNHDDIKLNISDYAASTILESAIKIDKKYNSEDVFAKLYMQSRCRNHFGTWITSNLVFNNIIISPLSDPILYKLNFLKKDSILYPLIILRACESLLDIPFESNRNFSKHIINLAKEYNIKYKKTIYTNNINYNINKRDFSIINGNIKNSIASSYCINSDNYNDYLNKFLYSNIYILEKLFKKSFIDYLLNSNDLHKRELAKFNLFSILYTYFLTTTKYKNKENLQYTKEIDEHFLNKGNFKAFYNAYKFSRLPSLHYRIFNLFKTDYILTRATFKHIIKNSKDIKYLSLIYSYYSKTNNISKQFYISNLIIKYFPNSSEGYRLLGITFFKNNNSTKCLKFCNLAYNMDSRNKSVIYTYVDFLFRTKQYKKSIYILNKYLINNRDDWISGYKLGALIYKNLNDTRNYLGNF